MKQAKPLLPLLIVLALYTPSRAQTDVTGTWSVEGAGDVFPFEVFLRAEGSTLTGMVSNCTSQPRDIEDGKVEGNVVTFKCRSDPQETTNQQRTVTFRGTVTGDVLRLTQELAVRPGSAPPNARNALLFGDTAPKEMTARRVPDGDLAALAGRVPGREFAAAVNLVESNVKVLGHLFLPAKTGRVRAVIAPLEWGLGDTFYRDNPVRRHLEATDSALLIVRITRLQSDDVLTGASAAAAEACLRLLHQFAQDSGHPELHDVPLLFWGFSRGGNWGPDFATLHPTRTIGFVLYQSAGGDREWPRRTNVPALFVSSSEPPLMWKRGRAAGEPWTFAREEEGEHGEVTRFRKTHAVVLPWIAAVIRQRVALDGQALRVITDDSSLLGNNQTGEFTSYQAFTGSKPDASWLPDEPTARSWRAFVQAAR